MSTSALSRVSQKTLSLLSIVTLLSSIRRSFLRVAVLAIGGGIFFLSNIASAQTPLVSANCSTNQVQNVLYFSSPPTGGIYMGVSVPMNTSAPNMAPYWDFRYVKSLSNYAQPLPQYANHLPYSGIDSAVSAPGSLAWGTVASVQDSSGSLVQTKCVNGYLAASAMVNGWDAVPVNTFGGPAATWTYLFLGGDGYTGNNTAATPWNSDGSGNLMLQGTFIQPFHYSADGVPGAEVNFNVFLANKSLSQRINFVISVYRSNGDFSERPTIGSDPTTGAVYVSSVINKDTQWVTKSPQSSNATVMTKNMLSSENWPYFYRVNITYANLRNVLAHIPGNSNGEIYGLNPADWKLTMAAVQTEITGSYKQSVGSSVRAFEVYLSNGPL